MLQRILDLVIPGRQRTLEGGSRWWAAVLALPAAALLSVVAGALAGVPAPFSPFYLALVVVTCWAGALPGLVTLGLTTLFFLTLSGDVFGSRWAVVPGQPVNVFVYLATSLVIVAACHQLRLARAEARAMLERLALVQADVGIGLWTLDLATRQLRTSGSSGRLHGREAPGLEGRAVGLDDWLAVVHPDDRAAMLAHLDQAIPSGEARSEHEFRVPLPDGSTRWINVFVKVHRDAAGRATHLSGAAVDVTRTRALRQAHAATEAQLRIISDSLPVLIAYATPDRCYRFNNRAYETWFGTSPESLAGRPMEDVLGPAAYAGVKVHLDRAFAGETARFRSRLDYAGLGPRDVSGTYVPHVVDGQVHGIVILVEDVSEQIAGEQRLRDSEARLRLAMEGARMGTWFSDSATGRVVWDAPHLRLLGYDPAAPPPASDALWRERLHPDDRVRVDQALNDARHAAEPFEVELRILRADDGGERWLALYGRFLEAGDGPAHQSIGVVFDVTARKRAELELERRSEELQTMLDLIPVGVAVAHDPRAERITLSPRLAAMLRVDAPAARLDGGLGALGDGVAAGATVRRTVPYRCVREGRELGADELPMRQAASTGREVRNAEFDVVFADGQTLNLLSSAAPLFDASGQVRGVIGAHVDVTGFKQVQAALEAADRRKDEFLATLAHELRNPLAPIRYSLRLLRADAPTSTITQVRDTIDRQSTQMARLLDDLLDVSRITRNVIELKRESIDLRQSVEDSVEVARPLIDAVHHRLVTSLPGKPVWVEADPTRLSQVVANLLQNAAKYTDPGGTIEVSVEQRRDAAVLRIRDSGIGIAPEMREGVFEIFSQVARPAGSARRRARHRPRDRQATGRAARRQHRGRERRARQGRASSSCSCRSRPRRRACR